MMFDNQPTESSRQIKAQVDNTKSSTRLLRHPVRVTYAANGLKADISFVSIKRLYQHHFASPQDEEGMETSKKVRRLDRFEFHLQ
jgi:hypothetical protein